jgi:hypothetical protein
MSNEFDFPISKLLARGLLLQKQFQHYLGYDKNEILPTSIVSGV